MKSLTLYLHFIKDILLFWIISYPPLNTSSPSCIPSSVSNNSIAVSQFIWVFNWALIFLNRINFFPVVDFVLFLFGILLSGKNNSFSSFYIEFLGGVHHSFPSVVKTHTKNAQRRAVLWLLSYMSWAKVKVRNILSVWVQVLKRISSESDKSL